MSYNNDDYLNEGLLEGNKDFNIEEIRAEC